MKTFILTLILSFGLSAINYGRPINDIYSIQDPPLEEEAYVDDIPFNTEMIFATYQLDKVTREYRNELEVNDIPFIFPRTWLYLGVREVFTPLIIIFPPFSLSG